MKACEAVVEQCARHSLSGALDQSLCAEQAGFGRAGECTVLPRQVRLGMRWPGMMVVKVRAEITGSFMMSTD
jgi:hypothetical protein|eukprot:COSAG01_NODE_66899_length_268_cov_1.514793_1_plen_72_part_00